MAPDGGRHAGLAGGLPGSQDSAEKEGDQDMAAHDAEMGSKAAASVSYNYKVAQGVSNHIMELEKRMAEIMQQFGLQVRAASRPPSMVQKMDNLHNKLFDWLRAAKMKNRATVMDTEGRAESRDGN